MAPPTATETCTVELHEFSPDHRYHISTLPQASAIASHSRTSISSSKASVQRIPTVTDDKYTISSPRKSGEIGPNDEEITDPSLRSNASGPAELVPEGALAVPVLQTWNNPSINKWRILAAFYSFIVLGEFFCRHRELEVGIHKDLIRMKANMLLAMNYRHE